MPDFSIHTAQNVLLDYKLAGVGDRVLAFIIDLFIIFAYSFGLSIFLELIGIGSNLGWWNMVLYLPVLMYHLLFEVFMDGQSPGKRQMKIKVMTADGSVPSIGAFLLRWMISPIDFLMSGGIAIMSIVLTQKGQRLGDLAAGTIVVKVKALNENSKAFFRRDVQEDYEPVFESVKYKITQKEIDLIKEVLRVRIENTSTAPSEKLREKLERKLETKSELRTVAYLHTIIKDFDYYQVNG